MANQSLSGSGVAQQFFDELGDDSHHPSDLVDMLADLAKAGTLNRDPIVEGLGEVLRARLEEGSGESD